MTEVPIGGCSQLFCSENQSTGLYMIGASAVKELSIWGFQMNAGNDPSVFDSFS